MEHIFERIVMKTLQRELHFDYGTNLARLRCLPPQSNALYIKSGASSENHSNIPKYLGTHFTADFRNLKNLAKITSYAVKLNWPDLERQ